MQLRVGLIQFEVEVQKDFVYTAQKAERYLKQASEKECALVCFPENFWFGSFDYYTKKEIEKITTTEQKKIIKWFQKKSSEYNLNIIAGSFIEKIGGIFMNRTTVINNYGVIKYRYDKQRLVPFGFEGRYVQSGNKSTVIIINGVKIGILICRDLFYPELAQNLRRQGAEIVIVPSFWSKRSNDYLKHVFQNKYNFLTEMKIVDTLCQARSFENEVAILYVNACGNLKSENDFDVLLGRTQVCLPFYGSTQKLNQNREGFILFDYDQSIIDDARRAYQLFNKIESSR